MKATCNRSRAEMAIERYFMQLLSANDMAKLGCGECGGCSACCRGMGQSILLDPYDLFLLQKATGLHFGGLMQEKLELCVEEGLILPTLKTQSGTDACGFLNGEGRCSIHPYRPGLCRLFPLGRKYDGEGLHYFLLEDACEIRNRTKVKIRKWLELPALAQYERFLTAWHELRVSLQEQIDKQPADSFAQEINVKFLELFYQKPYAEEEDFYEQFEKRREEFMHLFMCSMRSLNRSEANAGQK